MLAGTSALADRDRGADRHRGPHYVEPGYGHRYDRGRRNVLRLHLPVSHRHGSVIPLRKMIERVHGINPDAYELQRVIVRNAGHRDAIVNLRVGRSYSGPIRFANRDRIDAPPNRHHDGFWTLYVQRGHLDDVTVVLKPKYRGHRRHHRYSYAPSDRAYGGYRHRVYW